MLASRGMISSLVVAELMRTPPRALSAPDVLMATLGEPAATNRGENDGLPRAHPLTLATHAVATVRSRTLRKLIVDALRVLVRSSPSVLMPARSTTWWILMMTDTRLYSHVR